MNHDPSAWARWAESIATQNYRKGQPSSAPFEQMEMEVSLKSFWQRVFVFMQKNPDLYMDCMAEAYLVASFHPCRSGTPSAFRV